MTRCARSRRRHSSPRWRRRSSCAAWSMTPDSAFGRGRAGTLERVARDRRRARLRRDRRRAADSSTARRSRRPASATLLGDGDVEAATELARRRAAAARHRRRTATGGGASSASRRPTSRSTITPALPALGIYLGRVAVPERGVGPGHPALVSVGVRPTFHDDGRVLVEVYLLDWDGDLYDATLTVELDRAPARGAPLRTRSRRWWTQMRADEARRARAHRPGRPMAADRLLW